MILIFKRAIHEAAGPDGPQMVDAEIFGMAEGGSYRVGQVSFRTKQDWTRFIGAMQRGAIGMKDFEITIENAKPITPQPADPQQYATTPKTDRGQTSAKLGGPSNVQPK